MTRSLRVDRLVEIVGDEQDRLAGLGMDAQQFPLQDFAGLGVQRAERLVHQEHGGIDGERAGEPDALLHAAGQFMGKLARRDREADQRQQPLRRLPARRRRHALQLEAELYIAERGSPWQQVRLLEHEAAVAAGAVHHMAVEPDGAAVEPDQALDDAQQRGLAAAAFADQRDDLVLVDREGDMAQHRQQRILLARPAAHAERLRHVFDRELDAVRRRAAVGHRGAALSRARAWFR